jgi:hypothetical protein
MKLHQLIWAIALVSIAQAACTTNESFETTNQPQPTLNGTWYARSFELEGTEIIGSMIEASAIQFEPGNGTDGRFQWNITYRGGASETRMGDYTCQGDAIVLQGIQDRALRCAVCRQAGELTLKGALDIGSFVMVMDAPIAKWAVE